MKQRIDCHQHLHAVQMRLANYLGYVGNTVTRRLARTESGRTYIYRVRARLYGRVCYLFVPSRSEQAKRYMTMPAVTETFIECLVPY